jgi:DNA-binding transcriptional LysR family regulator
MSLPKLFVLYVGWSFRACAALGLGLSLTACAVPTPTPPAVIRVRASDVTLPLLENLAAAYLTATVQTARSESDFAFTVAPPDSTAFATPIGYAEFVVVVHPANPLASLTLTQTRAIFTGQTSEWAQVSPGLSGLIQVVSREDESEGGQAFARLALGGQWPTRTALLAPSWAAMREAVSGDANTIGYLPRVEVDSSVKALSVDGDLRALIVAMSAKEPVGPARDFLAWIQSAEGQAVVARRYEGVDR